MCDIKQALNFNIKHVLHFNIKEVLRVNIKEVLHFNIKQVLHFDAETGTNHHFVECHFAGLHLFKLKKHPILLIKRKAHRNHKILICPYFC